MQSDARTLIAIRVVVVTTLLLASLIIQYTVSEFLPINYMYLTAGLAYVLTLLYITALQLIPSRKLNLMLQTGGDLLVETLLVYFTGGLDSPFSFLYLVSIIAASMLLYRRGGLFTASAASILYGLLSDLMYFRFVPLPDQSWMPNSAATFTSSRLYINIATNLAGFYATALLTSVISEKLQQTSAELTANRQNLAELRALNQNVVESISSGLLTLSPFGTASFANPAAMQILQLPAASIVGCHIVNLGFFTIDEWNATLDHLANGEIVRGEKDFRVAEETRSIGYAATPLKSLDGKSAGYTLIFQDLTEMKKLEEELRLKDRMAAVGELSAGIAHEIRNPLAAIAGSVQILQKSQSLTPQEQRLMTIAVKETERLNKSIADFLRFVRPQEKRAAHFDVALSLSETLDLFANAPELKDTTIVRDIDPPAFSINGDSDQIRQVFWNLARNAVQAMPNGGTLTVRAYPDHDAYNIVISDSGHGINAADQQRLFQPFRTNFPSGTGLGMAISYRIVQEHGGRIDVVSREGIGTTITVSLPIAEGTIIQPEWSRRKTPLPATIKI